MALDPLHAADGVQSGPARREVGDAAVMRRAIGKRFREAAFDDLPPRLRGARALDGAAAEVERLSFGAQQRLRSRTAPGDDAPEARRRAEKFIERRRHDIICVQSLEIERRRRGELARVDADEEPRAAQRSDELDLPGRSAAHLFPAFRGRRRPHCAAAQVGLERDDREAASSSSRFCGLVVVVVVVAQRRNPATLVVQNDDLGAGAQRESPHAEHRRVRVHLVHEDQWTRRASAEVRFRDEA
mmetsp:Transcript_22224/g.88193  ORF Transcript_22224/g.88193 Transcript_22224/m.88193 type:complete len:243 (-) Transcript_22224:299-1027(-)